MCICNSKYRYKKPQGGIDWGNYEDKIKDAAYQPEEQGGEQGSSHFRKVIGMALESCFGREIRRIRKCLLQHSN